MIVCTNDGRGLKPTQLLLQHQFYEKELQELEAELAGSYFGAITGIPINSATYIDVSVRGAPHILTAAKESEK